jgi:hypothetical protein
MIADWGQGVYWAEVDMFFGKAGSKYLMIPVDRTTSSVITVRPMRKSEKDVFRREVADG